MRLLTGRFTPSRVQAILCLPFRFVIDTTSVPNIFAGNMPRLSPGIFSDQYLMSGMFFWLMVWRVLGRRGLGTDTAALALLAVAGMVIAYEPIWAIGTGRTATAEDAQQVCAAIRGCVGELFGADAAHGVRIQYGGSVKAGTIAELMAQPDIDGALVGGASLDADEFARICKLGR